MGYYAGLTRRYSRGRLRGSVGPVSGITGLWSLLLSVDRAPGETWARIRREELSPYRRIQRWNGTHALVTRRTEADNPPVKT